MYRPAPLGHRGSARPQPVLPVLLAGLGLAALVFGLWAPRSTDAGPDSTWQGGHYRDTRNPDRGGTQRGAAPTTRSPKGSITLSETAAQRPRLSPGDSVTLRALYEIASPGDVRETRVIRYDGLVLARLERVVSRTPGSVESEYRVDVPKDAADGWYSVTTVLEPARAATRSAAAAQAATAQKETGFYVETGAAKDATNLPPSPTPATPAATPATPATPASEDDAVTIKLWANQAQYRVGDRIALGFTTNRDAYVTLVNVGTSGEVTILFPNRFSGSHGVKGGRTYSVPEATDNYELAAKGPPGAELVYALATLKPVIFLPTDFQTSGRVFQSVTDRASSFTRDINVAAKSVPLREQAKAMVQLEVAR
jgi:Domain of unknown function (DUF4384)